MTLSSHDHHTLFMERGHTLFFESVNTLNRIGLIQVAILFVFFVTTASEYMHTGRAGAVHNVARLDLTIAALTLMYAVWYWMHAITRLPLTSHK